MKTAYIFPGQGSQFVGMGADYFDRFPELVEIADSTLGYSIKSLCLEDPEKCLNKTNFTQPALYTVNALTYAAKLEDGHGKPDIVAGHSLGEYNALLAAGAFDFSTGLRLVQKRGELMSKADQGGMMAVLGIDIFLVKRLLAEHNDNRVEIANINSSKQTILSGDKNALQACTSMFENAGAKVVPLNVSAAFHSSYMHPAKEEFSFFLRGFQFRELEIPVVANITAQLYPAVRFDSYLAEQITGSVKWHDTILGMLEQGYENIEEVGPGSVLTKLTGIIRNDKLSDENSVEPNKKENNLLFMYGGQGFHYLRMGQELYETREVFREEMLKCDAIVQNILGVSIAHEIYEKDSKEIDLENILISHPAIYSVGYCLTKELESEGIIPAAVMGYSLGEYVAATVAGSISLNNALKLVCEQAKLLVEHAADGSMLAVLTDITDYDKYPEDYEGATLGCLNYRRNFILSGDKSKILEIKQKLAKREVLSLVLPVAHSFHSHHIEPIKTPFKKVLDKVEMGTPKIKVYSPAKSGQVSSYEIDHFWDAIRNKVDFQGTAESLALAGDYKFIDLSPTASLASFLERSFGKSEKYHFAVNQFGNNNETIARLISGLTQ
ncbi:malonyl CoA-acyl carrier protein transacylase [Alteromonadaceae bacterium 2753L.S.0a.02]|nr:malonyl CoA-acyl carrier protein transacylase [Alteromonadaceae bacterium 2753L.S.0a.02]